MSFSAETCPECGQKYYITFEAIPHSTPTLASCSECDGTGRVHPSVMHDANWDKKTIECSRCHGTGKIKLGGPNKLVRKQFNGW